MYSSYQKRFIQIAELFQDFTLTQIDSFNTMSDELDLNLLRSDLFYAWTSQSDKLPKQEVITKEKLCDLFWEVLFINRAGMLEDLYNAIGNLKNPIVSVGVPPPPPPPPPTTFD